MSIDERFCLFPLTPEERTTCESIVKVPGSSLLVMPTHHISEIGDFMGFRYTCDAFNAGNTLPIVRNMFHGTTMVQCNVPESKILELMSNPKATQDAMRDFLKDLDENCIPATLDCMPEVMESVSETGLNMSTGMKTVDSQEWTPEIPDRIGIYHAYIRGYNREVRSHKLFIVCTGGVYKACDQYCNTIIDVGGEWTAQDVYDAQETWWVRKACQRARCRLIKQLADVFGLELSHIEDIQAFKHAYLAIPTTDTLEHDLGKVDNKLCVYNSCVDTTKHMNGMMCNMHPSEGVWLFKGAHKVSTFGSMYGDHSICGCFPVSAPKSKRQGSSIYIQDSSCIVRNKKITPLKESYMCFDEAYFKNLEAMQWNRDNGYEPLIPIVVGMR